MSSKSSTMMKSSVRGAPGPHPAGVGRQKTRQPRPAFRHSPLWRCAACPAYPGEPSRSDWPGAAVVGYAGDRAHGESMSGLKIYGIARTRAFRALWMAKELGLDYEHDPGRDRRRRRAHAGVSRHQSERAAAGHRRRRLRAVRVARHHALSRQEAFARPALSRHAGGRGAGLAVEPVGGHRGRSRRQHLVAARRAPAAGGAGRWPSAPRR